jgi:hypothetical protein
MTEQRLDNADVGAALQEVSCKAVAQRVERHGFRRPRRAPQLKHVGPASIMFRYFDAAERGQSVQRSARPLAFALTF